MIKAIVSDLDGTLLNAEHEISKRTAAVLKLAQSKGIRLIAATGRSWATAYPRFQNREIACDFILLNGAEFRDSSGNLLLSHNMDLDCVFSIIRQLAQEDIDFEINTSNGDYSTNTDFSTTALSLNSLDFEGTGYAVRKIFAFADNPEKIKYILHKIPKNNKIALTSSSVRNLEITSFDSQKGLMLERVLELYHISKNEVVIFGDGENDLSLFQRFPHTRAMGNGCQKVQGLAEKVIGCHDQDGVAMEIFSLLENL